MYGSCAGREVKHEAQHKLISLHSLFSYQDFVQICISTYHMYEKRKALFQEENYESCYGDCMREDLQSVYPQCSLPLESFFV